MCTYVQDITDQDGVSAILDQNGIKQVDFIQSDMAPNTI
jgi:23S rRNA U2552 (ribose-2'-O)-methylase RlmE/FtsJ